MSKTEENLKAAFAGESQARNKYDYYAKVAREEGYHYVAKIFEETALNEMQHAKDEFKKLNGIGNTKENLQAAIDGEQYETCSMYPEFAETADAEGFKDVARLFRQIGKVEAHHRDRYQLLLDRLNAGTLYSRDEPITWKCLKCGYVHVGKQPPANCPSCGHEANYFEPSDIF
ncbi:Rubrerythrin [Methanosarcinaceae archaeon Ag5]|uniref:Rubrerythrin n=1 Tax=Methanolapillus africanus TaxID=3028297 RepID=A0AAE4MHE7_9EURY|nr:Rubrerythrin [Methanosarcinaceae archaeon Ag5]